MISISSSNQTSYIPSIQWAPIRQKIASKLIPYYTLNANLESIKGRVSTDSTFTLNNSELAQVKEAFIKCDNLFAGDLLKKLTQLPPDEVKRAVFSAMEQGDETKIRVSLDSFLKALSDEKLILFTSIKTENLDATLAKNVLLRDKALNSVLYTKGKAVWKEVFYEISHFIHHLIETFISMTGFTEIGGTKSGPLESSAMSSWEAKAKIEFYVALLAYPSILFASVFAIVGSAPVAAIVAAIVVVASILFIPIYMRYLRPCPNQYSGLENLNQKILRNENPPTFQRTDVLNKIQDAFCEGKGVILTAAPGAGKTTIVDSLAEIIVAKKAKEAAGFLNKAQLFSANASQFKGTSYDGLCFTSLAERFRDHSKEFVLFIDEIAILFEEHTLRGKQDKPFLTFYDKFKNVICATTTEEYEKLIQKEGSINRRWRRIEIKPLTTEELESALYKYLHYSAPALILGENVVPYIMEKTHEFNPKTSQIDGAMSLLKSAISKASHITFESLEKRANDLKIEIEFMENHLLHSDQTTSTNELEDYQQKCSQLSEVKKELSVQLDKLKHIKKIEAIGLKLKRQGYELAAKSKTKSALQSRKWLINHATQQVLTQFIVSGRDQLGLPVGLNKALIDDIVKSSTTAAQTT